MLKRRASAEYTESAIEYNEPESGEIPDMSKMQKLATKQCGARGGASESSSCSQAHLLLLKGPTRGSLEKPLLTSLW